MANARRSLGDALAMTADKLAFIHGATKPTAKVEITETQVTEPIASQPEISPMEVTRESLPTQSKPIATRTTRKSNRDRDTQDFQPDTMLGMANLLVPLTTRLQPKTATALKRAGLEQKLRGRKPSTVQEIAEIAIQDWLKESGYLD
ncbi:MAG: hypothetical protein U0930_12350 [Pirellulales bacterium]